MLKNIKDRLGRTIPGGYILAFSCVTAMFATKVWWMPLLGLLAVLLDARGKVRADSILLIAVSILAYRFQTELASVSARQQLLALLISMVALVAVVFLAPGGQKSGRPTELLTKHRKGQAD